MADPADSKVRYRVDASRSRFTVQAFASGLLAGFGHNPTIAIRDFAGQADFVPDTLADASLQLSIKAASLTVVDKVSEKDRKDIEETMLNDVLEASLYPEILFQSTSITPTRIIPGRYKARIIGELTLHGMTRNGLWIMAQIRVDERELQASGDFSTKQRDFNLKPVSVAGGALKLKDELRLSFDVVALKDASQED